MFQAAGFAPRLTVLPVRLRMLQAGIEFMPAWNFLHGAEEHRAQYTHIFGAQSAFVFQMLILRNTALSMRAGGGMSFFYSQFTFNLNTASEEHISQFKWNPFVYGGFEFNCFLGPSFVLSIGAEYIHVFAANSMTLGFIRPIFGMGVWF